MSGLRAGNLAAAFLLELVALWAVARWGWQTGGSTASRVLLAAGAPAVWATVWAVFLAPRAAVGLPDLAVTGGQALLFLLAAAALWSTSGTGLAGTFAAAVLVNRVLLAVWEQ